jgi:hypothetical protein
VILDEVGRRYIRWQRKMHETWIGLKVVGSIALSILVALLVLYVWVAQ